MYVNFIFEIDKKNLITEKSSFFLKLPICVKYLEDFILQLLNKKIRVVSLYACRIQVDIDTC